MDILFYEDKFEPPPPVTRAGKMQNEFDAKFFDQARVAWTANKIRRGPMYYYKCEAIQRDGEQCGRRSKQVAGAGVHLCGIHSRQRR